MKAHALMDVGFLKNEIVEVEILGKRVSYEYGDIYLCKDNSGKLFTTHIVYLPLVDYKVTRDVEKEDEIYWQGYNDGYQDALDGEEQEKPFI